MFPLEPQAFKNIGGNAAQQEQCDKSKVWVNFFRLFGPEYIKFLRGKLLAVQSIDASLQAIGKTVIANTGGGDRGTERKTAG